MLGGRLVRSAVARRGRVASARTKRFFSSRAVILSATRTPIGSFNKTLASVPAPALGAAAIRGALAKAGFGDSEEELSQFNEAYLGNVLSAGIGQAPARQAILAAGLPKSVPATTVNKVCSSGMKTVMFAAQSILAGQNDLVMAGGFESMSQVPFYLPNARGSGLGFGHAKLVDGMIHDGLWDAFDQRHMGVCGDVCARNHIISREEQDAYALRSYALAKAATESGTFADEITPVEIPPARRGGKPTVMSEDEEFRSLREDKVATLRPAFGKLEDGATVTAANASTLNDGAAAIIVASNDFAAARGFRPVARILGFADAAMDPVDFTIAPARAIPIALNRAGVDISDVDYFEINEAFSVVALANMKLLNLEQERVNVHGGAVSLGHPLGASGARIITTLLNVLQKRDGRIGVAGICNGGGGASAIVVERLA